MKCFFCKYSIQPDYKDIENIEKFVTPRKKILSREDSGVCAKHQRTLSKHIKYARFLALLPFTSYQMV
ncbi:30S ribosomal protein S18 [Candidatus Roizmanbacteria bacterium CG_4_9_14_0_2_um_filter_39_13]|uniref:Small ribosomal subunit protein bS18 n=2 Tax=Candidatus Roizmaniibacteriota TaxID=1752723 RepID=A0A2M8F3S8_9BACT|nr:MAG: 30S ribosomal protein S18 [Candidatus Roizmanbacteria bacterium CG_4_10_14_0_2_um_filter_39_12]PJC33948.1 MAG: 30S ribosomal protein S18 [Candidatus Roizmanbacteria bacterium CG_4_9_14_0_2_um_filter_39_13]PJE61425.1 MAG: 30S ribosomal protein S18 [Candidatus Roizmanbacteria bacterium CG10_big_fil_rev_8_21_14_0_10_39_12]